MISSLLKKICCSHNWEVLQSQKSISGMGWKSTTYILTCKDCGKVKTITILDQKQ